LASQDLTFADRRASLGRSAVPAPAAGVAGKFPFSTAPFYAPKSFVFYRSITVILNSDLDLPSEKCKLGEEFSWNFDLDLLFF
jgi:hypothetical protein